MPVGPTDHVTPPAAPARRRSREHPAEGKWLGTAEVTDERDERGRGRRRRLRGWSPQRPSGGWLSHWLVRYTILVVILCFALLVVEAAKAQGTKQPDGFVPVPQLQARVTDQVNLLTADQRASLEAVLADYETKTGSQIAVLLMSTTAPEPIEQYSIRVTDAWKLGRKGVDDGVLLVVAKDNPSSLRRMRIEAGRGVQGVLTDAQSKRVLQDVIAPHFRNNDYYGGLTAGVGAIATLLDKEQFPAPAQQAPAPKQAEGGGFPLWPLLLFGVFVVLPMLRGGSRRRGLHRSGWGSDAAGVLIGSAIGSALGNAGRGGFGGGGGGFGGGGFGGGGGGTFDGGGASGDW
jgi:uncharacterized protein